MGYRNETEHLRAKVQELEGQLEAIRGQRLAGNESLFARKVRRQKILILVLALMASAGAGLCLLPTAALSFAPSRLSPAEIAALPNRASRTVAFEGEVNLDAVYHAEYTRLAPLVGEPRVLVLCGVRCPYALDSELFGETTRARSYERVYRGRLALPSPAQRDALETYAYDQGLGVEELRLIEVHDQGDPSIPLFVMLAIAGVGALALWGALLWHRRATSAPVPLGTPGDYVPQEPVMVLVLGLLTCRLYELYWLYRSTAQLRRVTGRPDLVPGIDVVLTICTFGFWSYWAWYRNAEAVDEGLAALGEPRNHRSMVVGLTLGSFACGLMHWALVYKLQETYNLLLTARRDVDGVGDGDAPGDATAPASAPDPDDLALERDLDEL